MPDAYGCMERRVRVNVLRTHSKFSLYWFVSVFVRFVLVCVRKWVIEIRETRVGRLALYTVTTLLNNVSFCRTFRQCVLYGVGTKGDCSCIDAFSYKLK